MIAIISPAMRMKSSGKKPQTTPMFLSMAEELCQKLTTLAPYQLESALDVNAKLALKAHADYAHFGANKDGVAAAFAFTGLCYKALDAFSMSEEELSILQQRVRIISAFYGLLRPLDAMQPYRLEMRTKGVPDIPDLYAYWGDRICRALYQETDCVLSLCSREYERAFMPHLIKGTRCIRCEFLTPKDGRLMMKPTDVKIARGTMARFIVRNRLKKPAQIAAFDKLGYCFMPYRSSANLMVFARTQ